MLSEGEEMLRRARSLARVLDMPASCFTARERKAYHIMAHCAGMPAIKDHSSRHAYGNEVLQNANRLLSYSDPSNATFYGRLQGLVITMQEFPAWYAMLTRTNEQIVNDYVLSEYVITGMTLVGFGSAGMGLASATVKGGLVAITGAAGKGLNVTMTAAARGAAGGLGKVFTGGATGPIAMVWVVGFAALTAIKAEHEKLGQEISRRYQSQILSAALYQRAFGADTVMPERYFFQVR